MPKNATAKGSPRLRVVESAVSPLRQHYFELLSDPMAFLADVSSLLAVMDARTYEGPGAERPPADLDTFLDMIIEDAGVETTALLRVLAQLAPGTYAARAADEAARRGDPVPPWVARLADAEVVDAGRMQDVLGDAGDYVFQVRSPGLPAFSMLVFVDRRLGRAVTDAFSVEETLDGLRHRSLQAAPAGEVVWLGVDRAAARGVVEAGIELSAMLLPQPETDSWPMSRAMTEWVMRMLPPAAPPETPEIDDRARGSLLDGFLASEPGMGLRRERVSPETARSIAELLVDFAVNYGTGDPLEWSPRGVDEFFEWWTRKVVAPELDSDVPEVAEAWVRFALGRNGMSPKVIRHALDAINELSGDYYAGRYHQPELDDGFDPVGLDITDLVGRIQRMWGPRLDIADHELPFTVGSEEALLALTDEPLPADEFDWSVVADAIHEAVAAVLPLIDRGADAHPVAADEVRTAQRRLLAMAASDAPGWFSPRSKPTSNASAICWLVGRANDLLNPYGPLTAAMLAEAVGGTGAPSQRAARLQTLLGMPTGYRHTMMGDARLLVSEFRAQLIELRDAP
ncbi:hypothetical protein [Flexivirga oryzae]|uniref:Uncharacterized protein n=1 Tax=Flexivirga oryzae TaxID=1794944 RepID=A0A839N1X5_9MICO|nr:hypothetical protein [Flexivirga oryzae]MBB2890799.1 hypothetical protein [Flexivirga oryzae]